MILSYILTTLHIKAGPLTHLSQSICHYRYGKTLVPACSNKFLSYSSECTHQNLLSITHLHLLLFLVMHIQQILNIIISWTFKQHLNTL